jgi:Nucleotidyl transferase AbiEii toxin, Type IV TA system
MASDRRPGNLAHLERLLSAWSREGDQAHATAGRLRRLVAISALATMLDGLTENGDTHLAFKGGASMEFRFGATARASRDVDALADVDFDEAFAEIGRRLHAGWEGFTGTLTERTEIIRAGIVPAPQRCKIKLSYRDRPFATLAFELGRAEANSFELLEEVANATNMDKVQLGPNSDIVVLGVHYQIAQKLHACTEIPAEGTNPRVHDLYDVLLLASLAENAGLTRTRAACEDTFVHRNKHSWPPALPHWDDWEFLWDSIDIPDDVRYPYREARDRIEHLIRAIASA